MNGFSSIFLALTTVALLTLPRRWALMPLLMGACYMTLGQGIEVGPLHFTVLRLLLLAGAMRVILRGERIGGGFNRLDCAMLMWAAAAVLSSPFHKFPNEALIFRLGLVYDNLGIYFLTRVFCQSTEDIVQFAKITAFVLVPVALEMVNEKLTSRNFFSLFGGVPEEVVVRDGKLRAQGPFLHAILAGTVGAVCVPLIAGLWRENKLIAKIGMVTCLAMVYASNSSGPIMSTASALFALVLWRWRHLTRQMRIAAVLGYLLLDLIMVDPAYYILARIDLTGSSTGWHRAALIESSIKHLNEWWLAGTDYTRHWMPTGVSWSEEHTDITNYYIKMGVLGGLPLMFLLILALARAFQRIGEALRFRNHLLPEENFIIWCLGASLFAHATTCVSVSYFDQSFLFLYTGLAMAGSLQVQEVADFRDVYGSQSSEGVPLLESAVSVSSNSMTPPSQ